MEEGSAYVLDTNGLLRSALESTIELYSRCRVLAAFGTKGAALLRRVERVDHGIIVRDTHYVRGGLAGGEAADAAI